MTTDSLGRRLRYAPPNPRAGAPQLSLCPADEVLFTVLHRHGVLPSHFLYEFTRSQRADKTRFQKRLRDLFHGDAGGPFLARPAAQAANLNARSQPLAYALAPRAIGYLQAQGLWTDYPPAGSSWFVHQLMQACVGASFELAAPARALRYVPRFEVLSRLRASAAATAPPALRLSIPVPGQQRRLIPDDLFAMEKPDRKQRYFIVEVDRATERMIAHGEVNRNTVYFAEKLRTYLSLLESGAIRNWWGFANPFILVVTTNAQRAALIVDQLRGVPFAERFLVCVQPMFGANWSMPGGVLNDLVEAPWITALGPRFISD